MRHPLWILNSTLLFLLLAALCFILFARAPHPVWESLEPSGIIRHKKRRAAEVNIHKIYEHDLFGTYIPEITAITHPDYVIPFPEPPTPRQIHVPEYPKPTFLEPLKISLKGIVVVLNDDSKNRAIIVDTATQKEELFKVGDTIEDAQLIKIFNKKVIFLRSNGQQEVLYLRPKDAQVDPAYTIINWKDIVRQINDTTFMINPHEFGTKIKTLGQFIDLLDLTTVHQQGQSVGCRIGNINPDSLGYELGLRPHDVIVSINNIPATDSHNRFKIYKHIIDVQTKQSIVVHLLRNNRPLVMTYLVQDFKAETAAPEKPAAPEQPATPPPGPTKEQLNILQERHKFAPTLRDIREKERQTMFTKGQKRNLTANFTE